MNEALQQELLKIIKESHDGIIQGIILAKEKAPELIHQIFTMGIITNTAWIGILSLIIIVTVLLAIKTEEYLIFITTGLFLVILGVPLYNLILIEYAPYLYLINFIKNM